MAQKHLKELLKEDQEPFFLKDYISDRKCLLNKAANTEIQLKKPKPMSKSTSIFSRNACFFSLQDSPDLRRSPLFDFTAASPVSRKSPNKVFLNVPAKTASMLLEAAMRIQKQSKPSKNSTSFGLFGSMLKRLTLRNRTHKLKTSEVEGRETVGNVLGVGVDEQKVGTAAAAAVSSSSSSSSSSCCNEGSNSSLDFESSSSGRSYQDDDHDDGDDDGFQFSNVLRENNGDYPALCLSPLSSFRFALHKTPSPPPKSPARRKFQDTIKYEDESELLEEDEEEKEQNSPVSVLDPPFEDDYDGHDEYCFDHDCSYAFVQRAKQQLLHKLHRFEKLGELDPIELEKRMIEDGDDDEDLELEQGDDLEKHGRESFTFDQQRQGYGLLNNVVAECGNQDIKKPGIKRLISDLIVEEQGVEDEIDDEQLIKRVCKRLGSWREVECNTIDMMVESDLRREIIDWRKPQRTELSEAAAEIEVAIFAVLVDELVEDLAFSC